METAGTESENNVTNLFKVSSSCFTMIYICHFLVLLYFSNRKLPFSVFGIRKGEFGANEASIVRYPKVTFAFTMFPSASSNLRRVSKMAGLSWEDSNLSDLILEMPGKIFFFFNIFRIATTPDQIDCFLDYRNKNNNNNIYVNIPYYITYILMCNYIYI